MNVNTIQIYSQALHKMKLYCSKEEHCIYDVQQKLKKYNLDKDSYNNIIKTLINEKYIDELRYAKAFANDKLMFNKWGKIKIANAMKQKHIDIDIIDKALDNLDYNLYLQILKQELIKKLKTFQHKDSFIIKQKLVQFAIQRGFEYNVIEKVIVDVCL